MNAKLFTLIFSFIFISCGGDSTSNQSNSNSGNDNQNPTVNQSSLFTLSIGSYGAEEMEGIVETSDGGFLIVGATDSFSNNDTSDVLIVKTDSKGNVEWAKTYGGPNDDDMAIDVKKDGNEYIVAGWTQSFGSGDFDFWVFKIDSNGKVQWEKAYGGAKKEQAWSVNVVSDGYIVTGGTTSFGAGLSDVWILKLNKDGSIIWQKTYGSSNDDAPGGQYDEFVARSIVDKNGDIVMSTVTESFGIGGDIWVVKIDSSNGNIKWEKSFGNTDEDTNWALSESSSGGYFIPGSYLDPDTGEADLWVIYVNENGGINWQKTYGISGKFDEALNVVGTSDGGAVISSYYEINNTDWNASLIKVDNSGNIVFSREINTGGLDWTNAAVQLSDGNIAAIGVTTLQSTDQDLFLLKVDKDGNLDNSCQYFSDLNLNIADTNITPSDTNATVNDTNVSPVNTNATVKDVSLESSSYCK